MQTGVWREEVKLRNDLFKKIRKEKLKHVQSKTRKRLINQPNSVWFSETIQVLD